MNDMCNSINWSDLCSIKEDVIKEHLIFHKKIQKNKLVIRGFSICFSGTQQNMLALIEFLCNNIKYFVYSKSQIAKLEREGKEPYREALKYFSDIDPLRDGKYGEMFLFMLTESILKIPIISYKIRSLTNPNDQVKGGDGIFFGKYENEIALLIGESKIMKKRCDGIRESLESLNRFHDAPGSPSKLDYELTIAKSDLSEDLTKEQLDYIYNCLSFDSEEFNNNIIVHPVLIIFETKHINKISSKSKGKEEAENLMKEYIEKSLKKIMELVKKNRSKYSKVFQVYIDFFFLPIENVNKFRDDMFSQLHGVRYRRCK